MDKKKKMHETRVIARIIIILEEKYPQPATINEEFNYNNLSMMLIDFSMYRD
jgi:hypothetical protein